MLTVYLIKLKEVQTVIVVICSSLGKYESNIPQIWRVYLRHSEGNFILLSSFSSSWNRACKAIEMLFYLYLPHLPSQISFTLKGISRTFMHLLCPLCIKLSCLESGLCESFHISELWVAHVRIWFVSELLGSSASARCYVLFVCKNRQKYRIELDISFKQKACFSHFISSLVDLYTHMHTRTHTIHQIEKQHQEDKRR